MIEPERTIEARFESGSRHLLDSCVLSITVVTQLPMEGVGELLRRALSELVVALDRLPCGEIEPATERFAP